MAWRKEHDGEVIIKRDGMGLDDWLKLCRATGAMGPHSPVPERITLDYVAVTAHYGPDDG